MVLKIILFHSNVLGVRGLLGMEMSNSLIFLRELTENSLKHSKTLLEISHLKTNRLCDYKISEHYIVGVVRIFRF